MPNKKTVIAVISYTRTNQLEELSPRQPPPPGPCISTAKVQGYFLSVPNDA